jgi:hypothetical protein
MTMPPPNTCAKAHFKYDLFVKGINNIFIVQIVASYPSEVKDDFCFIRGLSEQAAVLPE